MCSVREVSLRREAHRIVRLLNECPLDEGHSEELLEAFERLSEAGLALLGAFEGHRLVGVLPTMPQPDGTLFVWPPILADLDPQRVEERIGRLTDALKTRLRSRDYWLAQCLLDPEVTSWRTILQRHGFEHLADLSMLTHSLDGVLPDVPAIEPTSVTFQGPDHVNRFARLLRRTYIDTRDCPRLNGLRTPHQALAAHRAAGQFDPRQWRLYAVDGQDAGLMLVSPHPEDNMREVVYMGVVPEFRQRGLGRYMLTRVLHEARAAGCRGVFLAVDEQNQPARHLYAKLGFEPTRRLCVLGMLAAP